MPVKYFSDINSVTDGTVGRQLNQQAPTPSAYEAYCREVRQNEHLYMLLEGGYHSLLSLIEDQEEYDHYYGQYAMGMHLRYRLYALPEDATAE